VNLDDLDRDRPDLGCEPQQARSIARNLQRDETKVVVVLVAKTGAGWLGGGDDDDGLGARPALRDAVDRFIEQNLLDEHLSPSAVARAHGLSVRTINRAFNATGQTVGIRIRRLARARNELAERRQPIGTIATKWGFDDSSHFSRSFKACYGTSPKEFRDARVRAEQARAAMQQTGPRVQALTDASDKTGVTPARW